MRGKTPEGSSVGNHWIVGEGVLNQKGFQSSSHSELSREVSSGERKIPPWGPPDHFGVEHMSMCRQAPQLPGRVEELQKLRVMQRKEERKEES